jgi:histone H3/H4
MSASPVNSDFDENVEMDDVEEEEQSSEGESAQETEDDTPKEAKGAKRHLNQNKPQRDVITKNATTTICLKAEAFRHRKCVQGALTDTLEDFLHDVLFDTIVCVHHAKRKTVLLKDVQFGLRGQNMKLYA